MKRLFIMAFIAGSMLLASCSSHKNIVNANSSDRDGSSYEKAIVITETHEQAGIDAEYAWIRQHYPGAKTQGQALMYRDKKPFDLIHVLTSEGNKVDVYFDISDFFGKF